MNVLLISPQTPDTFWSFKHVLRFVSKRSTFPPLGLLTVAAMLPRDWELKVVDLNVTACTDEDLRRADLVMISAMMVHEAVGAGNRGALRGAGQTASWPADRCSPRDTRSSRRFSILCSAKRRN